MSYVGGTTIYTGYGESPITTDIYNHDTYCVFVGPFVGDRKIVVIFVPIKVFVKSWIIERLSKSSVIKRLSKSLIIRMIRIRG